MSELAVASPWKQFIRSDSDIAFPTESAASVDALKTLFLGDLSYFCTEEDLCTLFARFGRIVTVRVRRGVSGESLMHGFIALESVEAAQAAIAELDGQEFMGRYIRVQPSSDSQRPLASERKRDLIQVHVSFISRASSLCVTEAWLREVFSPFGEVADVAIKKHQNKQQRQSGYGFVYFADADAAVRAVRALKHSAVCDVTLDCSISHKSETAVRTLSHDALSQPAAASSTQPSQSTQPAPTQLSQATPTQPTQPAPLNAPSQRLPPTTPRTLSGSSLTPHSALSHNTHTQHTAHPHTHSHTAHSHSHSQSQQRLTTRSHSALPLARSGSGHSSPSLSRSLTHSLSLSLPPTPHSQHTHSLSHSLSLNALSQSPTPPPPPPSLSLTQASPHNNTHTLSHNSLSQHAHAHTLPHNALSQGLLLRVDSDMSLGSHHTAHSQHTALSQLSHTMLSRSGSGSGVFSLASSSSQLPLTTASHNSHTSHTSHNTHNTHSSHNAHGVASQLPHTTHTTHAPPPQLTVPLNALSQPAPLSSPHTTLSHNNSFSRSHTQHTTHSPHTHHTTHPHNTHTSGALCEDELFSLSQSLSHSLSHSQSHRDLDLFLAPHTMLSHNASLQNVLPHSDLSRSHNSLSQHTMPSFHRESSWWSDSPHNSLSQLPLSHSHNGSFSHNAAHSHHRVSSHNALSQQQQQSVWASNGRAHCEDDLDWDESEALTLDLARILDSL